MNRTARHRRGALVLGVVALSPVLRLRHAVVVEANVVGSDDRSGEVTVDDRQGHVLQVDQGPLAHAFALLRQSLCMPGIELRATQAEFLADAQKLLLPLLEGVLQPPLRDSQEVRGKEVTGDPVVGHRVALGGKALALPVWNVRQAASEHPQGQGLGQILVELPSGDLTPNELRRHVGYLLGLIGQHVDDVAQVPGVEGR